MLYRESKEILRKKFLNLRNELTTSKRNVAEENAEKIFLESFPQSCNKIISAYYPANNELSTLSLLKKLSTQGATTALPVIKAKDSPLDFQKWQHGEKLHRSKFFNIQEPDNKSVIPDIIILPLLAFDRNMNRLGYGGGFYDRTLKHLEERKYDFISIGYAYSFQESDEIPTNEQDMPVDYIITDKEILRKT